MEVVEWDLGALGLGFGGNRAEKTTPEYKMLYFIGIFSKFGTHEDKIWKENWAMYIRKWLPGCSWWLG